MATALMHVKLCPEMLLREFLIILFVNLEPNREREAALSTKISLGKNQFHKPIFDFFTDILFEQTKYGH